MLKKHLTGPVAIILLWISVNAVLYSRYGIKVVSDTDRYIEYAHGLMSGFYFDSHNFWYIGYGLYLAMIFKSGGGMVAVVAGQYVLSLIATLALYRASFLLWNSRIGAFVTCCLFLLFIDISQWNSYVLTESIYTSFICFSIYCLASIHKGERRWWFLVVSSFVIFITILIKPTGVALLGALVVVLVRRNVPAILVTSVLFCLLINRMLTTYLVIENYRVGEIIYAVTTYPDQSKVRGLVIEPPADLYVPPASHPPVVRIAAFVAHHPVYWTDLFLHKIFRLLVHTRPFWSMSHNLFSIAVLLVSYASFIFAIRNKAIHSDVVIFAITFLLIHILSVGITSDDWDGRFLIPMLPVIFICSGNGLTTWRNRNSTHQLS